MLLARVAGSAAPTPTGSALRATFVLTTAYALAAPYSLPWYDVLTMATLPALAATPLDELLTARWVVVTLAYVPGRVVAMSAGVEAFTLAVRRSVAPYAGWLVWAVVAWLAWRAWSSRAGLVSSSSVRTLSAITSGRARVAPTAGIAVPESLSGEADEQHARAGTRGRAAAAAPARRPAAAPRAPHDVGPQQDVDDEQHPDRDQQGEACCW